MLKVKVGRREPIDPALRRLGKKIQGSGLVKDVKSRQYHESRRDRTLRRKRSALRKVKRHQAYLRSR